MQINEFPERTELSDTDHFLVQTENNATLKVPYSKIDPDIQKRLNQNPVQMLCGSYNKIVRPVGPYGSTHFKILTIRWKANTGKVMFAFDILDDSSSVPIRVFGQLYSSENSYSIRELSNTRDKKFIVAKNIGTGFDLYAELSTTSPSVITNFCAQGDEDCFEIKLSETLSEFPELMPTESDSYFSSYSGILVPIYKYRVSFKVVSDGDWESISPNFATNSYPYRVKLTDIDSDIGVNKIPISVSGILADYYTNPADTTTFRSTVNNCGVFSIEPLITYLPSNLEQSNISFGVRNLSSDTLYLSRIAFYVVCIASDKDRYHSKNINLDDSTTVRPASE